ncbi:hypothetical protein BZM27_39640 [Paraburkholderia steynii]|uniref:Uncharacterized protein n=1 Tax=Paraburkholderia steynii TaxID=1245441 RepID=A0A4R0X7X7_9BURK|nr:hypothetical protein BZM27_39640 [Paraburkholderia steynii]
MASATEALAASGARIARVRAIGRPSTVLALTELTSAISVANIALVSKRAILDGKMRHMLDVDTSVNRQKSDSDRWFDMQSQMLVQGPIPQERFDYMQHRIELHRNEANRLAAHKAEVETLIGRETLALIRTLMDQQRIVGQAAIEANMAMRQELGFSSDREEVVRTSLSNQDEAGRDALGEYVTSIEASLMSSSK